MRLTSEETGKRARALAGYRPVDLQPLRQHSPIVAESVRRVQALAELLPQGSRKPERSQSRGVGGGVVGMAAADHGDFPERPRDATRGDELLRAVVNDSEYLSRVGAALGDLQLVAPRGGRAKGRVQAEGHVLGVLLAVPGVPERDFLAFRGRLALPLVADLFEADAERLAVVLEQQRARLVQQIAPDLRLAIDDGFHGGLSVLDGVHPDAALADLTGEERQSQSLRRDRVLAALAGEHVAAELFGHDESLRVIQLREQRRVDGLVTEGQHPGPRNGRLVVLGRERRRTVVDVNAVARPHAQLPGR